MEQVGMVALNDGLIQFCAGGTAAQRRQQRGPTHELVCQHIILYFNIWFCGLWQHFIQIVTGIKYVYCRSEQFTIGYLCTILGSFGCPT